MADNLIIALVDYFSLLVKVINNLSLNKENGFGPPVQFLKFEPVN